MIFDDSTKNVKIINQFIDNCDDFWNDDIKNDLDPKHDKIIKKFKSKYQNNLDLYASQFRNWEMHSDVGAPAQFKQLFKARKNLESTKYLIDSICEFILPNRKYEKRSLFDDLAILRDIQAYKLLQDNPVHLTPGVGKYYSYDGTSFNYRWLRYIYIAFRINQIFKK